MAQPVGLRRPHAEVIANDTTVIASFRRHCKSGMVGGRWNQCKVDELYMPTLLAIMGRDAETDCKGYLVRRQGRCSQYLCCHQIQAFHLTQNCPLGGTEQY